MKRIVVIAIIILLSLLMIACSADAPAMPERRTNLTAATAPLPHLLPEGTLLAVEFRDLAQRWSEVRAVRPLARLQDRLLEAAGLTPGVIPLLAGDRAVLGLVTGSGSGTLVPVALLERQELGVSDVAGLLGPDWSVLGARGAIWVAPADAATILERIALGDGTSLAAAIPMDQAESRLPPGGLVRGWVNPAALKPLIRRRTQGQLAGLVRAVGDLLAAELEAVRWIGFRRELEPGRLVGDAITVYDPRKLPDEVARVLDPAATAVRLPDSVPDDVVLTAAFRPEAGAALPWLQFVAGQSRGSPLRNIDFWVDEFESRSGRSLEDDLFGTIGERAWFSVFRSGSWATVLESRSPRLAEATVLELLDWSVEQAWARTLGLAVPQVRSYQSHGLTIHELTVRTPFGEVLGPVFAAVEGFLMAAADEEALLTTVSLLGGGAFRAAGTDAEQMRRAHASLWARGSALAGAIESSLPRYDGEDGCCLVRAVSEFLSGVSSVSALAWYETDAVRMRGELLLDEQN